jgi:hypothetical protein
MVLKTTKTIERKKLLNPSIGLKITTVILNQKSGNIHWFKINASILNPFLLFPLHY